MADVRGSQAMALAIMAAVSSVSFGFIHAIGPISRGDANHNLGVEFKSDSMMSVKGVRLLGLKPRRDGCIELSVHLVKIEIVRL